MWISYESNSHLVMYYLYNNMSFNKIIQNHSFSLTSFILKKYTMEPEKRKPNPADYLANERTFLAWVRTSIGIMAFGFVVVKFSLFVKQLSLMLEIDDTPEMATTHAHYSAIIGIILVVLGIVAIVMSYLSYRSTNKQLAEGVYQHSGVYVSLLTALIFLLSMLLVAYLIKTA